MRSWWLAVLAGLCVLGPARAEATEADLLPLCPPGLQLAHHPVCPAVGPSHYVEQLASAGLPYPLPEVAVEPIRAYRGLTGHAYARVITDTAPVYRHPAEAIAGLPPVRVWEKGFVFVSALGRVRFDGREFYQINRGEFMPAETVTDTRPSGFGGVFFNGIGARFGWVVRATQVSAAPGAPPDAAAPWLTRYQQVTALNVVRVGEWDWYEVAPGQWAEQRSFGFVSPAPPPGASGNVIAVDTYEQTLGVYRNNTLVFATLISSGSRYFPTRPGAFQIWAKVYSGRMTGAYFADRRDFYYLEDVPWTLYYDGDRALHGAYWHDNFGLQQSHGCVNLSPRDARWLYENANVGDAVVIFSSR